MSRRSPRRNRKQQEEKLRKVPVLLRKVFGREPGPITIQDYRDFTKAWIVPAYPQVDVEIFAHRMMLIDIERGILQRVNGREGNG